MTNTPSSAQQLADAANTNWLDRFAPNWLKPYGRLARWDRPIGWWLLLLPCWWSSSLASLSTGEWLYVDQLILFWIGAIAMRGAGCTYNDIVDRNLDGKVARTALRPIPSGQVKLWQAIAFMGLQCLVGLAVLLYFNLFTIWLGFASLITVIIYPFMKRITWWPQFFLGLAFSWGALMGWAGVTGTLHLPAILLYLGAICWTIGYDTIYAHQDREDDALIGIRSTARLFGEQSKQAIGLLYFVALALMASAFWLAGAGLISFVGLAAGVLHMAAQIWRLDIHNGEKCLSLFRANRNFGLILFAGLVTETGARYFL